VRRACIGYIQLANSPAGTIPTRNYIFDVPLLTAHNREQIKSRLGAANHQGEISDRLLVFFVKGFKFAAVSTVARAKPG
jgi:hypothetical protein